MFAIAISGGEERSGSLRGWLAAISAKEPSKGHRIPDHTSRADSITCHVTLRILRHVLCMGEN